MRCHPSPAGTYYCGRHDLHDKFQHLDTDDVDEPPADAVHDAQAEARRRLGDHDD